MDNTIYDEEEYNIEDIVKINNIKNLLNYLKDHPDIYASNPDERYLELFELTTKEYNSYVYRLSKYLSSPLSFVMEDSDLKDNFSFANKMFNYIIKCQLITEKDLTIMKVNPIIHLFQHNNSDIFYKNYIYLLDYTEKFFSDNKYNDKDNLNTLTYILNDCFNQFCKKHIFYNNYDSYQESYLNIIKYVIDFYCERYPDILNTIDSNNKYPINYCLYNIKIVEYIIKKGYDINNLDFIQYYISNKPYVDTEDRIKLIQQMKIFKYKSKKQFWNKMLIEPEDPINKNYKDNIDIYYNIIDLYIVYNKCYTHNSSQIDFMYECIKNICKEIIIQFEKEWTNNPFKIKNNNISCLDYALKTKQYDIARYLIYFTKNNLDQKSLYNEYIIFELLNMDYIKKGSDIDRIIQISLTKMENVNIFNNNKQSLLYVMLKNKYYSYIPLIIEKIDINLLYDKYKDKHIYYYIINKRLITLEKLNKLLSKGLKIDEQHLYIIGQFKRYYKLL